MNLRKLKIGIGFLYGLWFLMSTIFLGLWLSGRLDGGLLVLATGLVMLPPVASSIFLLLSPLPERRIGAERLTAVRRALIIGFLSMLLGLVLLIALSVERRAVIAMGIMVVMTLVLGLPLFRGQAGGRQ